MRKTVTGVLGLLVILSAAAAPALAGELPGWVEPMRKVHAAGEGKVEPGVLINIGDSITYSMAYFAPLQYARKDKLPPDVAAALARVNGYMNKECYRWKGGDKGSYSGQTAGWGLEHVDEWIAKLKPQVALVMFGSNDILQTSMASYEKNLRGLVQKLLDNGVVAILSTIPPMAGQEARVAQAVEIERKLAADCHVPLIDFYAHVLNRRPNDWSGTLPEFASFSQWEVPTLISKDGVHPSNPETWQDDYTQAGLCRNGFVLRSWLTLMAYAEVINVVLDNNAPSAISTTILGANPPAPADLPKNESPAPAGPAALPILTWLPNAPPLPAPTGEVVKVKDVRELEAAVTKAAPGQTILLADGEYRMAQTFHIRTSGLTVRGASGDPTKVVLDFAASRNTEGVAFAHCTDCTLADLTVQNVKQNGIKLNSNLGVERITLYHLISHNVWQRHVKGPRVPDEDGQPDFIEGCRVQYCLFYNDRPKRMDDEPYEEAHPGQFGGNYVGGMDIMSAKGWVISDNVFIGIHGRTGSARGAVFLWHNGTGCTIERNVIMDCDSGICLGNSSARDENRRHANSVLVRNNFIVRCPEVGILADHTRDCRIVNNTVFDPDSRLGRLIRVLHASDGLVVANNLLCGPRMSVEGHTGTIDVRNNLVGESKDYFVDPAHGDLHLTARAVGAIGHATPEKDVPEDFDRQRRGDKPDLGADQFVPPAESPKMP